MLLKIAQGICEITDRHLIGKTRPKLYCKRDSYKFTFGLTKRALHAFSEMKYDALNEGITLQACSTYRSFFRQTLIWNREIKKLLARNYELDHAINIRKKVVSIPGASRHGWGTDVDIVDYNYNNPGVDILQPDFYEENGNYHEISIWLSKNASKYGFIQPFTRDRGGKGFSYEPWHYSFAEESKPLLERMLQVSIHLDVYGKEYILGNSLFSEDFMETYKKEFLLQINPLLIPEHLEK